MIEIDRGFMLNLLAELLNEHSPTGYTEKALGLLRRQMQIFPFLEFSTTRKGALLATWKVDGSSRPKAVTAHMDTLGAMVKEIRSNGRLSISKIGGLQLNAVEAEGCWVVASSGRLIRGSLLFEDASSHVHGAKVSETVRSEKNMEVRLDEMVFTADETKALGVSVGDFICFDPRVEITNGFVRSRFLDDKACVASVVAAIKALADAGKEPAQTTTFHFSNYEEVGHGASAGIPSDVVELLTVDMAAVGAGQESDELNVTLCVKDSGGPYHYGLNNKLKDLAKANGIPYKTDIYPYYGSDGEAFWRAGGDVAVSLIGPGVDASHGYERTHSNALVNTAAWVAAFLMDA